MFMTEGSPQLGKEDGVLYANSDYAGLFRRFIIVTVDGGVILAAWSLLVWLWYIVIDPTGNSYDLCVGSWFVFIYLYLVVLKPSPVRTVGFWITGVRIVDYRGHSPSILRMTFRVFLWLLGPLNPIVDFFWLGGDRHRQTLRDKIAGTYVIKCCASPVSSGRRRATYFNLMGWNLIFWEIQAAKQVAQPIPDVSVTPVDVESGSSVVDAT